MDVLGHTRSGPNSTELQKRIVSCLLTLIDGLNIDSTSTSEQPDRVFFIGTTSKLSDVDPALRRSGRLEKEIEMSVPNSKEREEILLSLVRDMNINVIANENKFPLQADSSLQYSDKAGGMSLSILSQTLQTTAKQSHGMVGSDLLRLVKEAAHNFLKRMENKKGTNFHRVGSTGEYMASNLLNDFNELNLSASEESAQNSFNSAGKDLAVEARVERLIVTMEDFELALNRISPSALREIVVDVPSVYWTDIGGMDAVKQSLREVKLLSRIIQYSKLLFKSKICHQ